MLRSEDGSPGRTDWIDNRLTELGRIFAISVGGFSIMDNLPGLDHSPETRFPAANLAKTAPLWGRIRDKYSQSLWVMPYFCFGFAGRRGNDSGL